MDDGADLVKEVLSENPVEERGAHEEWEEKIGWHKKYDLKDQNILKSNVKTIQSPKERPRRRKDSRYYKTQQKEQDQENGGIKNAESVITIPMKKAHLKDEPPLLKNHLRGENDVQPNPSFRTLEENFIGVTNYRLSANGQNILGGIFILIIVCVVKEFLTRKWKSRKL